MAPCDGTEDLLKEVYDTTLFYKEEFIKSSELGVRHD
jgi:hypothetical protein|tara:strand:+ start:1539 stop:1649 length:111 start_codon:yes stop_codon:yes gene_type:complete